MTHEFWQQVKELFPIALELRPKERASYLDKACAADPCLKVEIESLIASYEKAGDFLMSPAIDNALQLLAGDRISESDLEESTNSKSDNSDSHTETTQEQSPYWGMTLSGRYLLEKELGRGGIGVVYLARDKQLLSKPVVIKVLREASVQDEWVKRKFHQEIEALSRIDHPGIVGVFDVGEMPDGKPYFVMQYVEGVTLCSIMKAGGMALDRVAYLMKQVGAALSAAHDKRVYHCDLKPENIMLQTFSEGEQQVKIIDFGIARVENSQLTTSTSRSVIAGTVSYMAPEQLMSKPATALSDIYALGVIAYEMVTGRRPFNPDSAFQLLDLQREGVKVLPADLRPSLPDAAQAVILKALSYDPEDRYQRAVDFGEELGRALTAEVSAELPAISSDSSLRWQWTSRSILVASLLALIIGGSGWYYYTHRTTTPSLPSVTQPSLPPMEVVPFTSFQGTEANPAFSPDGNQIAFAWNKDVGDDFNIYVKVIGTDGPPLRLTFGNREVSPTWTPDGRYITFIRQNWEGSGIFMVSALGGPERKLQTLFREGGANIGESVSWSPDGKLLAFQGPIIEPDSEASIYLLSVESGEKRKLTSSPSRSWSDSHPEFSPDGRTIAFTRHYSGGSDLYVVPVEGGEPKRLAFDGNAGCGLTWTPDGNIVFSGGYKGKSGLWKISPSGGTPEKLAIGEEAFSPSISRKGDLLAYSQGSSDVNIYRIEVSGSTNKQTGPTMLIGSTFVDDQPEFSPDGKRIAFRTGRSGSNQIWVCDSDGSNPVQLTYNNSASKPIWSPDGRQIAYQSPTAGGTQGIYVINAEGGTPRHIDTGPSNANLASWSRDGKWIYFFSERTGAGQVYKVPAEGGEVVQVTKQGGFAAYESPDGKYIYYGAKGQIWKIPIEGGEETEASELANRSKVSSTFRLSNQGIYFANLRAKPYPTIELFNFSTRKVTKIATIEKFKDRDVFQTFFDVSPDGRSILYEQQDYSNVDIMLVKNFR